MEETSAENRVKGGGAYLWEAILKLRESMGAEVRVEWTPSHIRGVGNEGVDRPAEGGRLPHPINNKSRRTEPPLFFSWKNAEQTVGGGFAALRWNNTGLLMSGGFAALLEHHMLH